MLPPIMFDAGFTLHKGYFFKSLISIFVLAVVGTVISTFVVGLGMYGWGGLPGMTLVHCLMYGALISAIDPVATLAVFHTLDVNHTLHMLVFGESVLNDAVSIVLYKTMEVFLESSVAASTIFEAIGSFLMIILGSTVIGIGCGLLFALLFKWISLRSYPSLELSVFFSMMYSPYLICESIGWSGITSLLFYGVVASHYTYYSLSITGQYLSTHFFRVLAFVSETVVFLYLGFSVFIYHQSLNVVFVVAILFWCLLGRALNIFPLCWVLNHIHSTLSVDISFKNQVVMWFAGLRGAIAFVLCLQFPVATEQVVTGTLSVVLVTVVLLGGGTFPLLRVLKVEGAKTAEHLRDGKVVENGQKIGLYARFHRFDKEYIWKQLRRPHPTPMMSASLISHQLGQHLHEIWRVTGVGTEIESGMGELLRAKEVQQVVQKLQEDDLAAQTVTEFKEELPEMYHMTEVVEDKHEEPTQPEPHTEEITPVTKSMSSSFRSSSVDLRKSQTDINKTPQEALNVHGQDVVVTSNN